MDFVKNTVRINYGKMFRRPLYKLCLLVLGLPINIITYFIYLKQMKTNPYSKAKQDLSEKLNSTEQAAQLREEVETQLQNKNAFLGKTVSQENFKKEADRIFNERFNELLEDALRSNPETVVLEETTFPDTFASLMENPLFLVLSLLLGWPMYILIALYANAYAKYIVERLVMMVFVIFGVTFLVFTILYLSPMDAATNILGPTATQDQITAFNATYKLDKSYISQLFTSFKGLMTFDLGISYVGNEDVMVAIMRKFPVTLVLTFFSLLLAIIIAIPAGIISAIKPYTAYDYVFMFLALLGLSIPNFWYGLILILNFSINRNILPASYYVDNWKSLIMPAIVLGTSLAATVTRMTRSSMLDVINQDYIVTAKAKGLSHNNVIMRHALTNAMIPIVTVIGLQFGVMLGGSAVTEKVFNVNGIGKYIVDKQFIPDTPVVLAGVVYVAIVISLINLFVDLLYTFLDPRIKSKLKSY